jgi:diguanylate cyclase (GGDEF)-like protein
VCASLVEERSGAATIDELTGLPAQPQLEEWMRLLLAEERRYGHGFAFALIDIEGLAKINQAYGRGSGDRMVSAVAGVIRRQIRACDKAFRLGEDEFAVIAPHTDAAGLVPMAERTAALIAESQAPDGPRIAIAAGVSACPADGRSTEHLIARAEEATYAAKAAGKAVGTRAHDFPE